jgi:hypothetical protein
LFFIGVRKLSKGVLSWVSNGKLPPNAIHFSFVENEKSSARISTFKRQGYLQKEYRIWYNQFTRNLLFCYMAASKKGKDHIEVVGARVHNLKNV